MVRVHITGYRPDLKKGWLVEAIQFYAEVEVIEAKRHLDNLMTKGQTTIEMPTRRAAEILVARLIDLGATVELIE